MNSFFLKSFFVLCFFRVKRKVTKMSPKEYSYANVTRIKCNSPCEAQDSALYWD